MNNLIYTIGIVLQKIQRTYEYKKMFEDGSNDTEKFISNKTQEVLYGLALTPLFFSTIILIILFFLGFTDILLPQVKIAKIFFFIVLFGVLIFIIVLRKIVRFSKKVTSQITVQAKDMIIKKVARTVDFEVKK